MPTMHDRVARSAYASQAGVITSDYWIQAVWTTMWKSSAGPGGTK